MPLQLSFSLNPFERGTDEAGRGCLAGPVTAAAVILPQTFSNDLLNDSKQLTVVERNFLRPLIEKEAVAFAYAHVFPPEIDSINILNASILAMHLSIRKLKVAAQFISVDGNRFKPYLKVPHQTVIKGDGKYMNIAAASVLAKTYRDDYMADIHHQHPEYNWKKNKGYPTREHREALREFGPSTYHRQSFKLVPEELELAL